EHGYNSCCLKGGMHVGTHMDAPYHMIADGAFMSDMPVAQFFGRGRLIDARGKAHVTKDLLDGIALAQGDIVLVLTGWYKKFGAPDYYDGFPEIAPAFAEHIAACGVAVLGLDTPSPDNAPFPIHKILLSKNVLIVENANNLGELVGVERFDVSAAPAKFQWDAAPVRVVAHVKA
ncbi:MAG: cyclase family protein, partial [Alphaproteobacteria bacterium]|nr:cyclase family protein [Alphaproteobacteria bacterium]